MWGTIMQVMITPVMIMQVMITQVMGTISTHILMPITIIRMMTTGMITPTIMTVTCTTNIAGIPMARCRANSRAPAAGAVA
jgi:hypothetical protein